MICKNCEIEFVQKDYRQLFCSKSCSASHNNPKRKKIRSCFVCKKTLIKHQKKFCSSKCNGQYKKEVVEKNILMNKKVSINSLRNYLLSIRKHECEICKGTEWFGQPIPLVMDHIDGNASNNSLDNLRFICPNCDRFLPTFGYRNKGKGRKSLGIKRN